MGFAALTVVVHQIGTDTIAAVEPRFAQALEVALGVRVARTPDSRLLGEAILAALNATAGDTNLVVIIDDLQALDASSAVVLSYVARRLARSKVVLIGAARSDEAPLFEGAGIGALRVQPLPAASAAALLSHRFPRLSGRAQGAHRHEYSNKQPGTRSPSSNCPLPGATSPVACPATRCRSPADCTQCSLGGWTACRRPPGTCCCCALWSCRYLCSSCSRPGTSTTCSSLSRLQRPCLSSALNRGERRYGSGIR
jgi:hypothetical protein